MKKVALTIAMAALIVFAGCKKDSETKGTVLKASIEQNQGDSKTSLNPTDGAIYWTTGDKILVNNGTSSQTFTLTAGAGRTNGTFTYAGEFEINENTKAVYPETGVITESSVTFTLPEEQNLAATGTFANGANPMVGVYANNGIAFVSVCGGLGLSLTGDNIDITAIEIVKEGEMLNGTYTGYFNNSNVDLTNGTDRVRLNCTTKLTAEAKEFYIVLPVGVLANGFTMNIYNGTADPIFTQTTTTNMTVVANTVKKMNTLEVTTDTHEYVDLGLPSGLLWATCNVGAEVPEGYGDYFAWGETTPKDTYSWSNYRYCNGSNNTLTKYCTYSGYGLLGFIDHRTSLEPSDDAATANWGSDWRMPTKEDFEELYNNTTMTWTQQGGVNGWLFTAANGNSLFLPAAGCRNDGSLVLAGSRGCYWSSSLTSSITLPYFASYFYYSDNYVTNDASRSRGQTVRPVRSARQN